MRLLLFLSSFLAISAHALPSHEDLLYPSSNLEDSLLSPRPHLAPVADFIYLVRRELFSEDHALQPLTLIPRAPKGGGSGSGGGGGAKGSGEEAGGGGGGKGKGGKGKGHSKDHGKDSKDDARLKEKKDMKQCTSLSDQTKKKMKNCLKVKQSFAGTDPMAMGSEGPCGGICGGITSAIQDHMINKACNKETTSALDTHGQCVEP